MGPAGTPRERPKVQSRFGRGAFLKGAKFSREGQVFYLQGDYPPESF